jgi:hypothetical protein
MQENNPDEFKAFIAVGKELEKLASASNPDSIAEFHKILSDSPQRRNLTFSVFKAFRNAVFNK